MRHAHPLTKLTLLGLLLTWALIARGSDTGLPTTEVVLADQTFRVEIAHTSLQRARGLMYRERLAADQGMLFLFPRSGPHSFWMKNTLIPLDIVFLDQDFRVVAIHHRALPCTRTPCPRYPSRASSSAVLELNGGTARRLGVDIGTPLRLDDPASLPTPE